MKQQIKFLTFKMCEANKVKPIYYCFKHMYKMFNKRYVKESSWLGNNTLSAAHKWIKKQIMNYSNSDVLHLFYINAVCIIVELLAERIERLTNVFQTYPQSMRRSLETFYSLFLSRQNLQEFAP